MNHLFSNLNLELIHDLGRQSEVKSDCLSARRRPHHLNQVGLIALHVQILPEFFQFFDIQTNRKTPFGAECVRVAKGER